jgi:hypothetical protein
VTEDRFIVTTKKSFDALGTTLRTYKAYRSCYDSICGYADHSHDALSRVRTVTAFAGDFDNGGPHYRDPKQDKAQFPRATKQEGDSAEVTKTRRHSGARKGGRKMFKMLAAVVLAAFLANSTLMEHPPVPLVHLHIEVTFCNFPLPASLKQANASFNVAYSFAIDEAGKPTTITRIMNDYLDPSEVSTCLKGWMFRGAQKGATFVATFRWQHAEGWVDLSITGPDLDEKIRVTGDRCPYRAP